MKPAIVARIFTWLATAIAPDEWRDSIPETLRRNGNGVSRLARQRAPCGVPARRSE